MKVTLDLTRLLADGKITQTEYDRLALLGAHGTGALGFNILVGFGVVAVAVGAVALVPTPHTALVLGLLLLGLGLGFVFTQGEQWSVFANICMLTGALMFSGGLLALSDGSLASFAVVTAVLAAAGIAARSGLLIALAVVSLAACLGAGTGYRHASYSVIVREPSLTVIVFSLLALATFQLSKRIPPLYEGIALIAARTSLLMVNFGFWVGSLWGDRLEQIGLLVPRWSFAIAWALALLGVGLWAVQANRRWVVIIAAVFGAIHFYTQWFDRLGATPLSILVAGLLTLALAIALWKFGRREAAAA